MLYGDGDTETTLYRDSPEISSYDFYEAQLMANEFDEFNSQSPAMYFNQPIPMNYQRNPTYSYNGFFMQGNTYNQNLPVYPGLNGYQKANGKTRDFN